MQIKNLKLSIIYKIILILIGLFSIVSITGVLDGNFNIKIFEMFTTLINMICVTYYIIDVINLIKNRTLKDWRPKFKEMVLVNMIITFIIAFVILRMTFSFDSFYDASFLGLHYIIPIMTIFDYLMFDLKGLVKTYSPFIWLIWPYLYFGIAIFCAVYGDGLGVGTRYPYTFINVDLLGIKQVVINIIVLTFNYFILAYLFYILDKKLSKKRRISHTFLMLC